MSSNAFQTGLVSYNAVSEIWAKRLLKLLSKVGVYRRITVDHSSELAANSDSIHLRIVNDSAMTVTNYYTRGANATTAGTKNQITYIDALMDKYTLQLTESPNLAITFEKAALSLADVPFQEAQIQRALYQISAWIDLFVMNTIIAGVDAGNVLAAFNATTAADGDIYDLLLQFAAKLKAAGAVPLSNTSDLFGDKGMEEVGYVVVNPALMRYILREPAFVKVDFTDRNGMWKDGVVRGTIAGLIVLESSNLPVTSGTVNMFGGIKSAAHYAMKEITNRMIDDRDYFDLKWSVLYMCGALVTHPKALVKCVVTV